MRIAVMIISLCVTMILGLQSCAIYVGSQILENEKNAGAGAIGVLLAFLFVLGAAFVLAVPRLAMAIFFIGAALAFLAAMDSGFNDLQIWGGLALALGFMSLLGSRELRRREVHSTLRRPVERRFYDERLGGSANVLLANPDDRNLSQSTGGQARVPCPNCAEGILPSAKVCRFCGHNLVEEAPAIGSRRIGWWITACLILLSIPVIVWLALKLDLARIEADPLTHGEEARAVASTDALHAPTEIASGIQQSPATRNICIAANRDGDQFVDRDGQRWMLIGDVCIPAPRIEDMNAEAQAALGFKPEPADPPPGNKSECKHPDIDCAAAELRAQGFEVTESVPYRE